MSFSLLQSTTTGVCLFLFDLWTPLNVNDKWGRVVCWLAVTEWRFTFFCILSVTLSRLSVISVSKSES